MNKFGILVFNFLNKDSINFEYNENYIDHGGIISGSNVKYYKRMIDFHMFGFKIKKWKIS